MDCSQHATLLCQYAWWNHRSINKYNNTILAKFHIYYLQGIQDSEYPSKDRCIGVNSQKSKHPCQTKQWKQNHHCEQHRPMYNNVHVKCKFYFISILKTYLMMDILILESFTLPCNCLSSLFFWLFHKARKVRMRNSTLI